MEIMGTDAKKEQIYKANQSEIGKMKTVLRGSELFDLSGW